MRKKVCAECGKEIQQDDPYFSINAISIDAHATPVVLCETCVNDSLSFADYDEPETMGVNPYAD